MADNDIFINGDSSSEFLDAGYPSKTDNQNDVVLQLNHKIEALEKEKSSSTETIISLKSHLESLTKENDSLLQTSETDKKTLEAIAKRASDLEGDVIHLQEELHLAMIHADESSREVQVLKARIGEVEEKSLREKQERESEIEGLKREKKVVEDSVGQLQQVLIDSKEKEKELGKKLEELVKKLKDTSEVMESMKKRETAVEEEEEEVKGWKSQLPLIGVVVAVAVAGVVCYIKNK